MIIDYEQQHIYHLKNERDLQREVVRYLKTTDLLFCSSMGGNLETISQRLDANLDGYTAGIPDLIIYTPSSCGSYRGFALEFKSPFGSGELSSNQKNWLERLDVECNYFCLVSNDLLHIIECIIKYTHGLL